MILFLLGFAIGLLPIFLICRWVERFHNERVDYWWREYKRAMELADTYRSEGDEWKR